MFIYGLSDQSGWFYTPNFQVYQKVNQNVYCYVSKYIGFYTVQLYQRGTTGYCTLEARSKNNVEGLFELGEKWLDNYGNMDIKEIQKNPYYIGRKQHRESCWL